MDCEYHSLILRSLAVGRGGEFSCRDVGTIVMAMDVLDGAIDEWAVC